MKVARLWRWSERQKATRGLLMFLAAGILMLLIGWTFRPGQPYLPDPRAIVEVAPFACPNAAPEPAPPTLLGRVATQLETSDDSWRAMRAALDHFNNERPGPLYASVFKTCVKFQYPPSSLLLLDAMQSMFGKFMISNLVLNTLSFGFLGIMLYALWRIYRQAFPKGVEFTIYDHAIPLLIGLTSYPVLKSIQLGQIQTWLNALFAVAVLLYINRRPAAAGILLGIAATIKPQFALFLPWALVRKDWPFARGMVAVGGAIFAISLVRHGLAPYFEYARLLSDISRHGESYFANQSLNGLLLRAFRLGANTYFERNQFAPYHPLVHAGTFLSSLLLIAFALFFRAGFDVRRNSCEKINSEATSPTIFTNALHLCLAALCFTIGSPIAWEHHYGIMPVVFTVALACLMSGPARERRVWVLLGVAWAMTTVRFAGTLALAPTPLNFLQSLMYFGALLLLVLLHILRSQPGPVRGSADPSPS
jgi:hypothetical protein